MSKIYLSTGLALALVFCGAASAEPIPVNQLSGDFQATNPSVASTNDGVHFGPYANGGSTGGSLYYSGFNGRTLGDISALSYVARYNTDNNTSVGVPYLRIFLNGDTDDVIFSPNTQPAPQVVDENVDNAYNVVAGTVRYDDDDGDGIVDCTEDGDPSTCPGAADNTPSEFGIGGASWDDVRNAHAMESVSGIYVTAGFSAGLNLSVLLTHLGVNADDFCFNCPPSPVIVVGPAGPPGSSGASTVASTQTLAASTIAKQTCSGDSVRKLHAPKRRGQRFLGTRATLRGKALKVSGRTITANLTGRPEGNYNVRLTSRYRTHSGRVVTIRTTRNLSIVCS
jgi:hypothetical protein